MAVVVADAVANSRLPVAGVVGVDLPNPTGTERVAAVNSGIFPFPVADEILKQRMTDVVRAGLLSATTDPEVYSRTSVLIVDVNLDGPTSEPSDSLGFSDFEAAIRSAASRLPRESLMIIETTVPPGTTERIVAPIVAEELSRRGLDAGDIDIAHSYERVMPGADYLASITNMWRVYSGLTDRAADRCADFLASIVNTEQYPLTRLPSPTASETAKVLENSYRAVNIAFIDEWGAFAEKVGVDLFRVIDSVRMRPSHANMREPGLGVGGYCLTKDPLFASQSVRAFWPEEELEFPMTSMAVAINERMPGRTVEALANMVKQDLSGMRILIVGAAYRPDVGDTRKSPSATLVRTLQHRGGICTVYDPLARFWEVESIPIQRNLPESLNFDIVVFAVAHEEIRQLDVAAWLGEARPLILDANHVLGEDQIAQLLPLEGLTTFFVGRGPLS